MKLKVTRGTVRHDEFVYNIGQVFELDADSAKALLREGVVEEVVQVVAQPEVEKPKKETKPVKEEKPKKEAKGKEEKPADINLADVKPTIDWTAKEILEYGVSKGFDDLEGKTKEEMLAIIEGGGVE